MKDIFQIMLSAEAILVVAAMLGFESVFGIDDTLLTGGEEMKGRIRQIVQQLENRKLLRYDLDRTLYIAPGLKRAIECICSAQTVGLFSTNLRSGKKTTVYALRKNSTVALLEHTGKGEYRICLSDAVMLNKILPEEILVPKPMEMAEMMLFEEAEAVQKKIEAFDQAEAENRIQKHVVREDSVKIIAKILSGRCGYIRIQIHRKSNKIYESVYNRLFAVADGFTVAVHMDENGMLHFVSADPDEITERICPYVCFSAERSEW